MSKKRQFFLEFFVINFIENLHFLFEINRCIAQQYKVEWIKAARFKMQFRHNETQI